MDAEDVLIQKCRSEIAKKLGWDERETWTNHDFQNLSVKIQETTGINLSVATLKRIWGKVKYDSKPTITTLNTLARFLGYEDWREFKQKVNSKPDSDLYIRAAQRHEPVDSIETHNRPRLKYRSWSFGVAGAIIGGAIVIILLNSGTNMAPRKINPEDYSFSSKKVVSEGVPNSVIFDYDATASPVDSVFIQQSWDERLRKQVSKDGHQHTSIYYTPGFFQAKLVIGKTVVKEHELLINSNKWIALVKQDPVPVYFKDEDFRKSGMLSVAIEKIKENNIPLQPETPWVSYYNVQDFGDLKTDNFIFESKVRSDYNEGSAICRQAQILLLAERNVIIVPLSIKGCVSDLSLQFGEKYIDGKRADLSAFGSDLSHWVDVRVEVHNKKGRITINGRQAIETDFLSSEKIVGMIFRFQGTGSVDQVSLANVQGREFFRDNF